MTEAASSRILYGSPVSGHSHRAELMLRLLGLDFDFRPIDLARGEQKSAAYRALNPLGTVLTLDDGGTIVADSTAILVYLASRYDPARRWLPTEPKLAAEVQFWLSAAQGPVYNGPAMARMIKLFQVPADHERAVAIAGQFLRMLEGRLQGRLFLMAGQPTVADVAIYSYVAHAPEGGVSLEPYPQVRAWLARVAALPGFRPMISAAEAGLAA